MVKYTKHAVRGISHIFLFSLIGSFLSYLARIYLARNLTIAEVGLFFAVFTVFSFLELFKDFGLNSALTKYLSEFMVKKQFNKAKSAILCSAGMQVVLSFV